MRSLYSRGLSNGALLLALCAAMTVQAAEKRAGVPAKPGAAPITAPASKEHYVDGIAAVVNKDVITLRELKYAVENAARDLRSRNIQVPDESSLRHQVLQRLIMDRLEKQEAERMGIRVDDAQVEQAIGMIAARNKISVELLRKEIEKSGVTWASYKESLRGEMRMDRLRQRAVDSTITITDAEVDAFLLYQQRSGMTPGRAPESAAPSAPSAQAAGPEIFTLAQILVRVPDGASSADVAALRKKAEALFAQVQKGADFASVAAASSDGPEALQGGVMGARPLEGWPDLFVEAVRKVPAGKISGLVQSGNGFHIIKVLQRASRSAQPAQAPTSMAQGAPGQAMQQPGSMQVTQTHAKHILIKTSAVMNEEQARQRLELVRQRLLSGSAKFDDMARQYSQDATAPQGGDLGWVNPGQTVAPFESAMNALQPGEISPIVTTQFGWHLIQVQERRVHDIAEEYQRMQARQFLFERRAQPAFDDWLEQLRSQAFIDNRLEKQERIDQANR